MTDTSVSRDRHLARRSLPVLTVSFVDRVSFAFMREHALTQAFAYDRHLAREGSTALA